MKILRVILNDHAFLLLTVVDLSILAFIDEKKAVKLNQI